MTGHDTGRIDSVARRLNGPHWADASPILIDLRRDAARGALAAADGWDAEHGVTRVPTDPSHPGYEATVERVARALAVSNGTEWDLFPPGSDDCVYRRDARVVLAALRGEG